MIAFALFRALKEESHQILDAESAEQPQPELEEALGCGTVAVVDCPVDYTQNMNIVAQACTGGPTSPKAHS